MEICKVMNRANCAGHARPELKIRVRNPINKVKDEDGVNVITIYETLIFHRSLKKVVVRKAKSFLD